MLTLPRLLLLAASLVLTGGGLWAMAADSGPTPPTFPVSARVGIHLARGGPGHR